MADKTINQLTQATGLTDGSLFVIEQNSTAKQANWGMMKNYISPGVASQYSTSATYNVGDYVIYNGSLYRCNTAITTGEAWTAAHWTATVLGDDVSELKSALTATESYSKNSSIRISNANELLTGFKSDVNSSSYTFVDRLGNNKLAELVVSVKGSQSGSGTPSSSNIRPFSFPASVAASITDGTNTNSATIDLSGINSVYSGTLEPFNGIIKPTEKRIVLDGSNLRIQSVNTSRGFAVFSAELDLPPYSYSITNYTLLCDRLQNIASSATWNNYTEFVSVSYAASTGAQLVIKPGVQLTSKADMIAWLEANTPEIVYTCTDTAQYAVNAIALETYKGVNTLSVTNGEIKQAQSFNSDMMVSCSQFMDNGEYDYMCFVDMVEIGKTYTRPGASLTANSNGTFSLTADTTSSTFFTLFRHSIGKGKILYVETFNSVVPISIYINDKNNSTITSKTFSRSGQFGIPDNDNVDNILVRIDIPAGTNVSNAILRYSIRNVPVFDELNVLVYGNSFSYSTLSYVPSLLAEAVPNVNVTFGILYSSGMQFSGHISNFNNDTPYSRYNEYKTTSGKWEKIDDTITGKMALNLHRWDCIVLQQSVEHLDDFDSLEEFADILNQYLTVPVKYLYNMGQARGANGDTWLPNNYTGSTIAEMSDKHFMDIADYAHRALDSCIISDVIPSGTAVQNARTTTLAQYGESGNLCKDTLSHLQNGIGILCAGYAASYKILESTGRFGKIYGFGLNPTDLWLTNTNVPSTMHGNCVGITKANKILGMKCAMMAIKNPFEITDCSNI